MYISAMACHKMLLQSILIAKKKTVAVS